MCLDSTELPATCRSVLGRFRSAFLGALAVVVPATERGEVPVLVNVSPPNVVYVRCRLGTAFAVLVASSAAMTVPPQDPKPALRPVCGETASPVGTLPVGHRAPFRKLPRHRPCRGQAALLGIGTSMS